MSFEYRDSANLVRIADSLEDIASALRTLGVQAGAANMHLDALGAELTKSQSVTGNWVNTNTGLSAAEVANEVVRKQQTVLQAFGGYGHY